MYTKVNVATSVTDEPLPGIIIETNLGDVVIVLDNLNRQLGVHGPDEMTMNQLTAVVDSAGDDESQPFKQEFEAPLIFEDSFFWTDLVKE